MAHHATSSGNVSLPRRGWRSPPCSFNQVGPTLNAYTLFAHPLRGQFDSGQRADTEFSRVKQGACVFVSAITQIDFFSSVAVRSGLRGKKLSTVQEHRAALNLLKMCVFAADVVDVHDPLPYGSHEFPSVMRSTLDALSASSSTKHPEHLAISREVADIVEHGDIRVFY